MKLVSLIYCIGLVLNAHHCIAINKSSLINIRENNNTKNLEYPKEQNPPKVELKDQRLLYIGYNLPLDKNLEDNIHGKEKAREGRFMASYFFPLFPQFYDVDYNDVWNFLKSPDTIGYFLFESFLDVCSII